MSVVKDTRLLELGLRAARVGRIDGLLHSFTNVFLGAFFYVNRIRVVQRN